MSPGPGAWETLAFIQGELEAIYGVEAPRVQEFLVGGETARGAGRTPSAPEELLVLEETDGVALGLYLDDADIEGLLRELRATYRLGGGTKIAYLGAKPLH